MDVVKLHNSTRACAEVTPFEGLYVISQSNTIEPISTDTSLYFQKLWLVPAKSVSGGVFTANSALVRWGKSGNRSAASLTSLIVNSNGEAVATATAHGMLTGMFVTIAGATPSALNGSWPIYDVTPDTFKFRAMTGTPFTAGPATGTITATRTQYLPWMLQTTDLDAADAPGGAPKLELPLGQRMRLSEIIVRGTAADGVWFSGT